MFDRKKINEMLESSGADKDTKQTINNYVSKMSDDDIAKISSLLGDEKAIKQLLESPKAKELIKRLNKDKLTDKITQLLNDPAGMDMVKSLAGSLLSGGVGGMNGSGGTNNSNGDNKPATKSSGNELGLNPQQMATIMKVITALKSSDENDEQIRLIMALKPHLSPARQKKADNAAKMLKIARLMPMIKASGLIDLF